MYLEGIEMLQLLKMRVVSLYENGIDDGDLSYGGIVCLIVVLTLCREAKERKQDRKEVGGADHTTLTHFLWHGLRVTCSQCARGDNTSPAVRPL